MTRDAEAEKNAFAEALIVSIFVIGIPLGIALALYPSAFDTVLLISSFIFIISLAVLAKIKKKGTAFRYIR